MIDLGILPHSFCFASHLTCKPLYRIVAIDSSEAIGNRSKLPLPIFDFFCDSFPCYMIRDRDQIYGEEFRQRVSAMSIEEVLTAFKSPWQNGYVERLIGSIRRECLDHVMVLGERHLRRILYSYFVYYHCSRTHLSLAKDAPDERPIQRPEMGEVIELAQVGGLHHRYERRAA